MKRRFLIAIGVLMVSAGVLGFWSSVGLCGEIEKKGLRYHKIPSGQRSFTCVKQAAMWMGEIPKGENLPHGVYLARATTPKNDGTIGKERVTFEITKKAAGAFGNL